MVLAMKYIYIGAFITYSLEKPYFRWEHILFMTIFYSLILFHWLEVIQLIPSYFLLQLRERRQSSYEECLGFVRKRK